MHTTTLTRRAALAGALAAAVSPVAAVAADTCSTDAISDLVVVDGLIRAHAGAIAAFEVTFAAEDRGEATAAETFAALDPIDHALIALCAATLSEPEARRLRREYLADKLLPATYGCEDLMQAVYAAFLA